MPLIRNNDNTDDIPLADVDMFNKAADAANRLWHSIHTAAKRHGGRAMIRVPDDGEIGYVVRWDNGPKDWADAYVVSEGADAPGFTAILGEDKMEVIFMDLD